MRSERWAPRWRTACAVTAFFASTLTHSAIADCVQIDIAGRWQMYATVLQSPTPHWVNRDLTVTPAGAISSSSCDSPVPQNLEISSGEIKIADTTNCVFTGRFELGGTPNGIQHATLSPDKSVASGVGASSDAYFTFTMIRTSAP